MNLHLRNLRRPLFAATAVAALGIGVPAALALTDAPARSRLEPAVDTTLPTPPTVPAAEGAPVATTSVGSRPTAVPVSDDGDISGPCDEAEHADDPRCGAVAAVDQASGGRGPEDDSGPGSQGAGDPKADDDAEDNSGSGSHDDADDEDRSGSNSGPG